MSVMNIKIKITCMIFLLAVIAILSVASQMPLYSQSISDNNSSNTAESSSKTQKVIDSARNPDFNMINSTSGLPLYWFDSFGVCGSTFYCTINSTDGWFGNNSFQLSTQNNTENTWSWISSQPIVVEPNEGYEIIAHMKLNERARQSHILLEGYNNSVGEWYQIEQCPAGTNGPLNWEIFDCKITVPTNTTAMILTLNAGWSSQIAENAVTSFDAIHVYKIL
jgi:hypothetical protein